ncbi:MAG: LamG domain-containing protein [Polyangiaceae bacterium]
MGLVVLASCASGGGSLSGGWSADGGEDDEQLLDASSDTFSADAKASPDAKPGPEAGGGDAGQDASFVDANGFEASVVDSGTALEASPADAGDGGSVALPSPIGAWSFDEGTGTSSADLSGNGHPAVLMGGASWTTAGKEGAGLALDGTSGYADVGATLVNTTASFSLVTWAELTTVGSWQVALSEDDVTGSLFALKLRGDGSNQFDFDIEKTDTTTPAFVVAQSTTVAQAATWVHLAGVYDASGGGALKVYVDGSLQADAAVGQALLAATGHFVIGRGLYNGVTGSFLGGTVDDVAVYGVALTDAQVAAIYGGQH